MTDAALLAAIKASSTAYAQAKAGNDAGCAATIAATLPPVTVSPTIVDARILCTAFANAGKPLDVVQLLTALQTLGTTGFPSASPTAIPANPIATLILGWLNQLGQGADISNQSLQSMLTTLSESTVGGAPIIPTSTVATLLSLCQVPGSVPVSQVSHVMLPYRPGGIVGEDF